MAGRWGWEASGLAPHGLLRHDAFQVLRSVLDKSEEPPRLLTLLLMLPPLPLFFLQTATM